MNKELRNFIKDGIFYGLLGGCFSFLFFMLVQNILAATEVMGFIWVATITICATISACTGILVKIINKP